MNQGIKAFIAIFFIAGALLLAKGLLPSPRENSKATALKKYLLENKKPQRIEIFSYTQKFKKDVSEIKKIKIPQDPKSKFYATIQFFTDESDASAPLIAQIRFIDIQSENVIKEESLNLY